MEFFFAYVFVLQVLTCWFMTGVIWVVQLILYPNFKLCGEKEFGSLHLFHTRQITWIVAPAMFLELSTAAWLAFQKPDPIFISNFVSVILLWGLTALVNVPTHNRLKFDSEKSKHNLVIANWPRTVLWSLRSILLGILISQLMVFS